MNWEAIRTWGAGRKGVGLAVGLFLGIFGMVTGCQGPRYVSSSHFSVLGYTNLANMEAFAQRLIPRHSSALRARVRKHAMSYALAGNPLGRVVYGFDLEVSAAGRSREAAMQAADDVTRQFRLEFANVVDVNSGHLFDATEVRDYSTMRDAVLPRIGPSLTRLCSEGLPRSLWGRFANAFGYWDFP